MNDHTTQATTARQEEEAAAVRVTLHILFYT